MFGKGILKKMGFSTEATNFAPPQTTSFLICDGCKCDIRVEALASFGDSVPTQHYMPCPACQKEVGPVLLFGSGTSMRSNYFKCDVSDDEFAKYTAEYLATSDKSGQLSITTDILNNSHLAPETRTCALKPWTLFSNVAADVFYSKEPAKTIGYGGSGSASKFGYSGWKDPKTGVDYSTSYTGGDIVVPVTADISTKEDEQERVIDLSQPRTPYLDFE